MDVPELIDKAETIFSSSSISLLSSTDSTLLIPFLFSICSREMYSVKVGRKSKLTMNEMINFLG